MKKIFFLLASILLVLPLIKVYALIDMSMMADVPSDSAYVTNGVVESIEKAEDGTTYIAGNFSYVGPRTGSAVPIDTSDGSVLAYPEVVGTVNIVVPDGTIGNGWYIGGDFDYVGGVAMENIAHISGNGTLDVAWDPAISGVVKAIAVNSGGTKVYVGGGTTSAFLTEVNAATGIVTAWTSGIAGLWVTDLEVGSNILYVAGYITSFGGTTRNSLAAFDISGETPSLTAWNPSTNGISPLYLELSGSEIIYVGGSFTTIGGQSLTNLAAVSTASGSAYAAWAPSPTGAVSSLEVSGTKLYVGGEFSQISGVWENNLTSFDTDGGLPVINELNIGFSGPIYSIAVDGSNFYVGGNFVINGESSVADFASFNKTTEALNPAGVVFGGTVRSLARNGTELYVGGDFLSADGELRDSIAALDADGVLISAWNPQFINDTGTIYDTEIYGTNIYVGGQCNATDCLRVIDLTTGAVTSLGGSTNGTINVLEISGDNLYIGGSFQNYTYGVTSYSPDSFIVVDKDNGDPSAKWSPELVGTVSGLVVYDIELLSDAGTDTVYLAGVFSSLTGDSGLTGGARTGVGSFTYSALSQEVTNWAPEITNVLMPPFIYSIEVDPARGVAYIGGGFAAVGGSSRTNLAAVNATTGAVVDGWNPKPNGSVYDMEWDTNNLYVGGGFTTFGDGGVVAMPRMAVLDRTTAVVNQTWDAGLNGTSVKDVLIDGTSIFIGGDFTMADVANAYGFAIWSQPTLEFSVASSSGSEAATPVTLTINLSEILAVPATVNYTVTGTATGAGADYTLANGTATVAAGTLSTTISLVINNDTGMESSETVIVTLSGPTNAALGTNTVYTYTITDNDTPTIQFNSTSSSGLESVLNNNIQVDLSFMSGMDATVNYTVAGTATAGGTDYLLVAGTATITAGNTSVNIPFDITNDALDENSDTIIVTLSGPTNSTLGSNTTHTYTITDDDAAPTISFSTASGTDAESVTPVPIQVNMSAISGRDVTFEFAITGTATNGSDYTIAAVTRTISAGSQTMATTFPIANDLSDENDETVILTLSNISGATVGAEDDYTYTIQDNDASPEMGFVFSTGGDSESVTPAEFAVELAVASGKTITFNYAFTGTATDTVDYNLGAPLSGTGTINPGETSFDVSIPIVDDAEMEGNETIIMTISSPTNASLSEITAFTYTIEDNDLPTIQFSTTTSSALESVTSGSLSLTLSDSYDAVTSVDYVVAGTATGGGVDYTLAAGTATITAGSTTGSIPITIAADSLYENNETIVVTISNPLNSVLGANTQHTYTITDDDTAPTIQVTGVDGETRQSGAESVATSPIRIFLSEVSGRAVTFDITFSGTANLNDDHDNDSGSMTINAGSLDFTGDLEILQDIWDESNETLVSTLSNPVGATLGVNFVHTYVIVDDDGWDSSPDVSFSEASATGAESVTPVAIELMLSEESLLDVTVDYEITGTTTSGVDFVLENGTVTISYGEIAATLSLEITDDILAESAETVIVTLSNPSNAQLAEDLPYVYTYTITDNDTVAVVSSGGGGGGSGGYTPILKKTATKANEDRAKDEVQISFASSFTDVQGHWAEDFIFDLEERGVVSGKSPGNFDPDSNLTRAELVKIGLLAFGYELDSAAGVKFKDVEKTSWYAPFVAEVKEMGIVVGYPNGTFGPEKPITRAESLKILIALSKLEIKASGESVFHDVKEGQWFEEFVVYAYEYGIVNGKTSTKFGPNDYVTRAEMAKMAVKVLGL